MSIEFRPGKKRLVIYTVLTGGKEALGRPLVNALDTYASDLEIDFVCITDAEAPVSDIWSFRKIDELFIPAEKQSRHPKILPHQYFDDYDYSLYIDNIVTLRRLPTSADLESADDYLFALYRHNGRSSLDEEARAIVGLAFDEADIIAKQLLNYSNYVDPKSISPLSTCTVILRSHRHPQVRRFSEMWWTHFLAYSKRDQMSFDFVRMMSKTTVRYLPGSTSDSDLIEPHYSLSANRILANFDHQKYRYERRFAGSDRETAAHYLASKPDLKDAIHFAKTNSVMDYLATIGGSGMGSRHYPRHDVARLIEQSAGGSGKARGILLVAIGADEQSEVDWRDDEINQAASVISSYFTGATIRLVSISRADLSGIAKTLDHVWPGLRFDLILAINANGQDLSRIGAMIGKNAFASEGVVNLLNYACTETIAVEALMPEKFNQAGAQWAFVSARQQVDGGQSILSFAAFKWKQA